MTGDDDWGGFAPPPFKAEEALAQLKRSLRDLKLSERGQGFELRGKRVLELTVSLAPDGPCIKAKLAQKPALTPEWDSVNVSSASDQRKLLDDIKKRLLRWNNED